MSSIELQRIDRRILLPVLVLPPDTGMLVNGVEGMALLDTGATSSGIKASIAGRLGIESVGKRLVLTAHGEAYTDRYIFRLAITPTDGDGPAYPFVFDETVGFTIQESASFDVLLGMDILARCDMALRRDGRGSLAFGRV